MAGRTYVEQLAPLDLLMPRTYIRVLFVFDQADPTPQVVPVLQSGLDRVVEQLPWLSGRVFPKSPVQGQASSIEMRWNAGTAPTLVDKGTIEASYKSTPSNGMSAGAVAPEVWPVSGMVDETSFATGAPVFATSIFSFADGGVGLCVCLHHNVVDGAGFSEIMRLWAQSVADPSFTFFTLPKSRSERLSEALLFDLQETSSLSTEDLLIRHPEYSKTLPTVPEEMPSCTSKLFVISMHWVGILKELLRKYISTAPSTNTVISALIWTTVTRIRVQSNPSLEGEASRLAMAVNGRQRIGKDFSSAKSPYFGNAVFYSLSKFSVGALATSDEAPLHLFAKVCEEIAQSQSHSTIDSQYVAEVYHLIDRMEDSRSLFVGWDLFGSRDFTITNWADLGLYDVDFGEVLGRPKLIRLPYIEADGVAIILPRQRAAAPEVLEVMVMLRRDHMDALQNDPLWNVLQATNGGFHI